MLYICHAPVKCVPLRFRSVTTPFQVRYNSVFRLRKKGRIKHAGKGWEKIMNFLHLAYTSRPQQIYARICYIIFNSYICAYESTIHLIWLPHGKQTCIYQLLFGQQSHCGCYLPYTGRIRHPLLDCATQYHPRQNLGRQHRAGHS